GSGSVKTEPVTAAAPFAPGVYVYRFGAALYYANASRFTEEIVNVLEAATDPIQTFIVDAEAMTDVDYSGADSLRQI
ncbi:sodium-independent anion transporter, partial [Klebsiella pneumoniae]|nr:sodium-independent anion transporter [Klebsiella pneumoniae]